MYPEKHTPQADTKGYKLKISFLLPNQESGGARAIVRFGNELLKEGHHVRIFYKININGIVDILRPVYQMVRYGPRKNWIDDFQGEAFSYRKLEATRFSDDELIVSMCAQTTFDACSLPENVGIKVLHCHGAEIENWDYMVRSWQLNIPKIVVSSHLVDLIKKETNQEVVGVAPDGVDLNEYYPCVSLNDRRAIGGGIRWGHTKDPENTINIFQKLHKVIPDANLITFGPDRRPKNLEYVEFVCNPSVSCAREIYSNCKIWFLASKKEGFGLPVLEAMACGCVVVSTACGGPADIITDGVNGFLVEVGNVDMMVNKIKMIWSDDGLQKKMSENAVETAKKFTWQAGAAKLEMYLQDIYRNASRRMMNM